MQVGRVKRQGLKTGSTGGFSLVELLVVVLIISILGAVVFPVIVKAKETAKISECLSNMRQIGIGLHMYVDDYNSRFPAAVPYGSPDYWAHKDRRTLQDLLESYVETGMIRDNQGMYQSAGVFQCPGDIGALQPCHGQYGIKDGEPVWRSTGSSYQYFSSMQEDWDHSDVPVPWTSLAPLLASRNGEQRVGAPMSAIVFKTKKAVLSDLYFWHLGDRTPDDHIACCNTLFVDGHADRVRGADHLDARLQQLRRWHSATEINYEK
ncbi:MAG: DUF1559 domain-containing protein [Armatimonadota bacterium]|nr:DUF1559 domain-containing protein [bacterium]